MNYDHTFHAGNPADVVKHAALVLLLRELLRKEAPLHYVETHAGAGWYTLSDREDRPGEWRHGLGRLLTRSARRRLPELTPWLELLPLGEDEAAPAEYPGSPAFAQGLLRSQDKLELYELSPPIRAELERNLELRRDRRAKSYASDGYRGLLGTELEPGARLFALIDPPYEDPEEWDVLDDTIRRLAVKRPGSVVMLWYPVKAGPPHAGRPEQLRASLRAARTRGAAVELVLEGGLLPARRGAPPKVRGVLEGTGLLFVDAPQRGLAHLAAALPELARCLARPASSADPSPGGQPEEGGAYELRWWGWG